MNYELGGVKILYKIVRNRVNTTPPEKKDDGLFFLKGNEDAHFAAKRINIKNILTGFSW